MSTEKQNLGKGKSVELQSPTVEIRPENPEAEGDLACIQGVDDGIDATQVMMMLMVNQKITVRVIVEIDGKQVEANSIMYGIKDKKPYLRISNRMFGSAGIPT